MCILVVVMQEAKYSSLHEWMDATGTDQRTLIALVKYHTGKDISPALMSMILRGSRRCSRWNASVIHLVTGVPMESLMEWPRRRESDQLSGKRPKVLADSLKETGDVV